MTATFASTLRCFRGCPGTFPVTTPLYRCPACDGLLEVHHDRSALRAVDGPTWRRRFEERFRGRGLDASGVWGKREWVAPELTEEHIVSLGEGATPLVHAARLGRDLDVPALHIKQCGTSHTGSFKDLGMTVLVSVVQMAIAQGALAPTTALACASTGDTSAALAAYGAAAGRKVVVLLPKGLVSTAQLVQPLAHGATVLALQTDFDGCMAIVKDLAARGLIYLANSMNPLRIEGQKTVALEIAQQLGWEVPQWVVLPSGNLGNAAALHAGFGLLVELGLTTRLPRLLVAQAANANPLYRAFMAGEREVRPIAAKRSLASAIQIGNPVSAPRAMAALKAMNGIVEEATEDELADAAARADATGVYACPHTAVALACLTKARARGVVAVGDQVVVVSTASGLKFTEFKLGYHEGRLDGVATPRANRPETLPADVEVVARRLQS